MDATRSKLRQQIKSFEESKTKAELLKVNISNNFIDELLLN